MQGRRVTAAEIADRSGFGPHDLNPGEYYRADDGWRGRTPNGLLVWLKNHRVAEHPDGTISVPRPGPGESANSILAGNGTGNKTWHGFIANGVWESC